MRKFSREILFKMIFAQNFGAEATQNSFDEILELVLQDLDCKKEDIDLDYITNAYNYITTNFDSLKQTVADKISSYKASRIYNTDLIILVVAVYELNKLEMEPKIVISEALKLAKKYSTEQSIKFINGVLGAILKDKNE